MLPGNGNHVAISPKHCIIAKMAIPVKVYPRMTERGPACVRAPPIPKNRPVPIVPPRAMNYVASASIARTAPRHERTYLNVSRLQAVGEALSVSSGALKKRAHSCLDIPSRDIAILLCRLDVSINVGSLSYSTGFGFDPGDGIDIVTLRMAIVVGGRRFLLHGVDGFVEDVVEDDGGRVGGLEGWRVGGLEG